MSIKISEVNYFSFSSKLNEKKKVSLENMVLRVRVQRKFLLEGDWPLGWGVRNFLKSGAWQEMGGGKIEEVVLRPSKKIWPNSKPYCSKFR